MNRCRHGALVPVNAWQWMGGDEYLSHHWENYAKKDKPAASGLFYVCALPFVGTKRHAEIFLSDSLDYYLAIR